MPVPHVAVVAFAFAGVPHVAVVAFAFAGVPLAAVVAFAFVGVPLAVVVAFAFAVVAFVDDPSVVVAFLLVGALYVVVLYPFVVQAALYFLY